MDDYYETKVLADITEKGLKPGDLVGELADPNAPSAAALAAAELANAQKADRSGGAQGIYRAGGPTTLFGGPGWGPYSDGPLNAVRKSLLNRDGLNEENWMFVAAERAAGANADWAKQRRRALVPYGGIFGPGVGGGGKLGGGGGSGSGGEEGVGAGGGGGGQQQQQQHQERGQGSAADAVDAGAGGEANKEAVLGNSKGQGKGKGTDQEERERERAQEQQEIEAVTRRRKRARREEKVPRGVYEPHSGIVLCKFCLPFFLSSFVFFFFFPSFTVYSFLISCSFSIVAYSQIARIRSQRGLGGRA